ncbi:hypothetical protein CMQ_7163 [Grosmannia clavigera kw1407]|uniref:Uncharacterized protein n=1 Tax=Grosmannia clavigera (strain kw1407 / UAMH 11150) TaxID=655863 RepID=F0XQ22_GROCL|nr:uncharacterized protein CMQ_7163 [Grosmannia clavigera kw1407]EFX00161.1 hypothetical protein CMQ_7163 [Grosmannia clavigera kw1407]
MVSFSRGLAGLGHGMAALRSPCQPRAGSAGMIYKSAHSSASATRLLLPSSPGCQLFSSFCPRAAQRARPKVKAAPPPPPPSGTARRSPLPPPPAASSTSSSTAAAIRTFADQLGRRAAPTLLYEAPSHFWFRLSCTSAGMFCIGYTIVNYWSIYLRPPPDLVWWVPHAFGVICVVMAGLGGYFILGGARIIRSIHAVPASRIAALAGPNFAAKAAKAAGSSTPAPVFLEVEIGRMLPVLPARKLYVQPVAMSIPFRLVSFGLEGERIGVEAPEAAATSGGAASPSTGYERVLARRAEEERRKKSHEYEMNHLMTAPFRHAWQGARVAWVGVRRAFSREGFVPVDVDGQKYKLDVTGGWALENGRALDRLVTIKEGQL